VNKDSNFVTYGLGACWLPTTKEHNPKFHTANSWASNGVGGECSCYYGGADMFGEIKLGEYALAVPANTRTATRFDLHHSVWVSEILVGMKNSAGANVKAAIYTDNLGAPETRIAATKGGMGQDEKGWVELAFDQFYPNDRSKQGVYLAGGSYWLSVSVGGQGATLLAVDGAVGPRSTISEAYSAGNSVPALDFGSGTSDQTVFSVYAAYTVDTTVHVERDLRQSCPAASSSCETCMRTTDSRNGFEGPCSWMMPGAAVGGGWNCEPTAWALLNGLEVDHSCSPTWGLGFYTELQFWTCDGEAMHNPEQVVAGQTVGSSAAGAGTTGQSATTEAGPESLELCAEDCKLANRHWAGWNGPMAQVPDGVSPFYCKAFTWEENSKKCTLFSDVHKTENIIVGRNGWQLETSSAVKCFVPNELPNPCAFEYGEWIRDKEGDYFYVGEGGFLYKVPAGTVPKCDGESVFGPGRTYSQGPENVCNGYFKAIGNNPADITCARCLEHMLHHNMLAGELDGSRSTCGSFGTATKRACEGTTMQLSCTKGVIDLTGQQATFGRIDENFCPVIPRDENTGAPLFTSATVQCGSTGNVHAQIFEQCQGKTLCSVDASAATLGDQGCPTTFKYLQLQYKCA